LANRWKIPAELEREVKDRDHDCIYCRRAFPLMPTSRGQKPSWEHIINDASIITREKIRVVLRVLQCKQRTEAARDMAQ
jgi:hypothetical protein